MLETSVAPTSHQVYMELIIVADFKLVNAANDIQLYRR